MRHPLHDLPPGPRPPHEIYTYVEIPRGSRNKYELDKETGLLKFDRILYSAVHYPGDYGFIPRTLAGDGDPLDVLVVVTEPTFPGCLMVVRPVGVFLMEDDKGVDEKIHLEGKHTSVRGWRDLDDAHRIIEDAMERYDREESEGVSSPPADA